MVNIHSESHSLPPLERLDNNVSFDIHALLGVQKGKNIPMFNWDWSFWKFLPTMTRINYSDKRRDRLNRTEVWNKYGCAMHFFTLEFQKLDTEKAYAEDAFFRNVGFVRCGCLFVTIFGLLAGMSHLGSHKYLGAPLFLTIPIFAFQYSLFTFFPHCTERYYEHILFFSSVLGVTIMVAWTVFGLPLFFSTFSRETDSYRIMYHQMEVNVCLGTSASMLTFLVIILAVFRLRFASFSFIIVYFLILYRSLSYIAACYFGGLSIDLYEQTSVWGNNQLFDKSRRFGICHHTQFPGFQNTCLASILLLVLSYSLEVFRRKDFIQAQMVLLESQRSDNLLQNILPPAIIKELKSSGGRATAQSHDEVTILFSDVVDFTAMAAKISAEQLVDLLDHLFHTTDALASENGVEKIKTIGDSYMAVSGIPDKNPMHAKALTRFALRLVQTIRRGNFLHPITLEPIQIRVGIHSGHCIAGVLGQKKFAYDVWGDAVNTASRMESNGEPGKVHVSESTAELINEDFFTESRGVRHIKGKGEMQTYFVLDERRCASYKSFVVTTNEDIKEQTKSLADALEAAKEVVPLDEINAIISEFSSQIVRGTPHGDKYSKNAVRDRRERRSSMPDFDFDYV